MITFLAGRYLFIDLSDMEQHYHSFVIVSSDIPSHLALSVVRYGRQFTIVTPNHFAPLFSRFNHIVSWSSWTDTGKIQLHETIWIHLYILCLHAV